MTLPRKLSLAKINDEFFLKNIPLSQLNELIVKEDSNTFETGKTMTFSSENFNASQVRFSTSQIDFELIFSNKEGDTLVLDMDQEQKVFSIDRRQSGVIDFEKSFAAKIHIMPVQQLPKSKTYDVRVIMDVSSIEVFINDGQYVMTEQIFPKSNYTNLLVKKTGTSSDKLQVHNFQISSIKSIW